MGGGAGPVGVPLSLAQGQSGSGGQGRRGVGRNVARQAGLCLQAGRAGQGGLPMTPYAGPGPARPGPGRDTEANQS